MKRYLTLILLLFSLLPGLFAQPSDSVRVSLVTCSPAGAVWQQYGHTALRYQDPSRQMDVAVNYGLFSFSQPHFVWRFVTGQTDYIVGAEPWASFLEEYMDRGSSVTLQELSLTPSAKQRLYNLLAENLQPGNREYRYNFLYKNCSTMARDILFASISLYSVCYAPADSLTYRQILHESNARYPWSSFGIDLLLGKDADEPVDAVAQDFSPLYLSRHFATATLTAAADSLPADSLAATEHIVPLVAATQTIVSPNPLSEPRPFPLTPEQAMWLLLLLTAIVCMLELIGERIHWWFDILLFGLQGLAGVIVTFLFFFSTHPCTDSNLLVLLLNPVPLVCLPFIVSQSRRRGVNTGACAVAFLVLGFLAAQLLIHQQVPRSVYIFSAALLLRLFHHTVLRGYLLKMKPKNKLGIVRNS